MPTNCVQKLNKQPVIKGMVKGQNLGIIQRGISCHSEGLDERYWNFSNPHASFEANCAFLDQRLALRWGHCIFAVVIRAKLQLTQESAILQNTCSLENILTLILSDDVRSIEGIPVTAQTSRCGRKPGRFILSRPSATTLLKCALAVSNFLGHGIPLPLRIQESCNKVAEA